MDRSYLPGPDGRFFTKFSTLKTGTVGARMKRNLLYRLLCLVFAFSLMSSAAYAEDETYRTFVDGDVYVDVMITNDSVVTLDSENTVFDFTNIEKTDADTLYCMVNTDYTLTNTSSDEVTVWFAKPQIMKVKEVLLLDEEVGDFDSKAELLVDGEQIKGFIYAGDSINDIMKKSLYDTRQETFSHYTYKTFLNEAVFAFSDKEGDDTDDEVTVEDYLGEKRKSYYYQAIDGEERLCAKVFKLTFKPAQTKHIQITDYLQGKLSRQTKYSNKGGTYSFVYNAGGLNSFYSVGELVYSFREHKDLPLMSVSVPKYLDDDVWTVKYMSTPSGFEFSVGSPLTVEQVKDINMNHGIGKKILNVSMVLGALLIVISVLLLSVTIYHRIKSGIEYQN